LQQAKELTDLLSSQRIVRSLQAEAVYKTVNKTFSILRAIAQQCLRMQYTDLFFHYNKSDSKLSSKKVLSLSLLGFKKKCSADELDL
jgi:hypothetical protein